MPSDIEATYRAWIACIQERRWTDLPAFTHETFEYSSGAHTLRQADLVAHTNGFLDIRGEDVRVTLNGIISGPGESLVAQLYVDCRPIEPLLGVEPTGDVIRFFQQQIVSLKDGRVSKVLAVTDFDHVQRQLSGEQDRGEPDDIEPRHTAVGGLTTAELDRLYRDYITCINEDLTEAGLSNFCHPIVVHSRKELTLERYCALIQGSSSAVRDMTAHIHTLVAQEQSQRVGVRLEWSGTPVTTLQGVEPNGRSVRFPEHVIYQLKSGKIARVWSVVDWEEFRRQMSE
ncbi:hypothetical protein C8F04DRAFT_1400662 [Mycena alexandri]|uniref:SnoaL-like polyketide cyclase n=1 Tax=Mycena alexandri TaxID=1745969 RepID=A0AAD6WU44_9AGAR|nr:hypothetical protein C8F04DRAFT_1400662 [Mycena alexandri]